MVGMMQFMETPIKTEPSDENFQLLDEIKEDLSESVVQDIKEELIKEGAEEEEECRFIKDEKISDFKLEKAVDCYSSIKSEELNIEEEYIIKDENISDIELGKVEDCYASIKSEELNIEEENRKNYFLCDCGEVDDVTFCSKCTMLVVIKDNPVPMGTPDRAAQTIPKKTLELKTSLIHGRGIFALRSLQKGVQLGPYEGKLTKLEANEGYRWKLHEGMLVDATNNRHSNYLRYINSTKEVSERNLVPFQYKGELYYRTCRAVKEGEELLVNFNSISADSYFQPQEESFEETFYTCKFCHVALKSNQFGDQHPKDCRFQQNRRKLEGEIFQCRHCHHFVTTSNILTAPERRCALGKPRIAPDVKKYTCDNCDYSASRKNLNRHSKDKHERNDILRCSECDYTTLYGTCMYAHKRRHATLYDFKCPVCETGFDYKRTLERHILSQHPDIKRHIQKCPVCDFVALHNWHMKKHLSQHYQ